MNGGEPRFTLPVELYISDRGGLGCSHEGEKKGDGEEGDHGCVINAGCQEIHAIIYHLVGIYTLEDKTTYMLN